MASTSRASEIPLLAYFIYKDTSKFVIAQKDFFPMDEFSELLSWGRRVQFWTALLRKLNMYFRDEDLFLCDVPPVTIYGLDPAFIVRNFIIYFHGRGLLSAGVVRNTHSILDTVGERRELTLFQNNLHNFITILSLLDICIAPITNSIITKALDRFSAVWGLSPDRWSISSVIVFISLFFLVHIFWHWKTGYNTKTSYTIYRNIAPQLITRCSDFKVMNINISVHRFTGKRKWSCRYQLCATHWKRISFSSSGVNDIL